MKRKAAYPSKDTWKEEGVLSEFISQEKEEGNNRINTEFINSETFLHINKMVYDLLQALMDKIITNMEPL